MRGGEDNQEAMGLVGRNPRRDLMAHKGWRKEARSAVEKLSKNSQEGHLQVEPKRNERSAPSSETSYEAVENHCLFGSLFQRDSFSDRDACERVKEISGEEVECFHEVKEKWPLLRPPVSPWNGHLPEPLWLQVLLRRWGGIK